MKISVLGVGYLGAVHAASMAEIGHEVIGLDIDAARIAALAAGDAPFHEPGFPELLRRGLDSGRLRFTTDYAELAEVDVHFLGLGTPQRADGFGADLTAVHAAVDALAAVLPARDGAPTLVVGKSTVPAGTARDLATRLSALPGVSLLWNPEFLREGFAVQDTLAPDRLVYGVADPGTDAAAAEVALLDAVYAPILAAGMPRLVMGYEAAELVKVSANAFLATKISFINAISELCEATGADVTDVARAIGLDDRIGPKFLRAGVGFGGGCLPKDIRAFIASAEDLGVGPALGFLREVDAVNQRRRVRMVEIAREMLGSLAGRRITVLGAAFKPDSDDVRDSPALEVASRLLAAGAQVTITDPEALANATRRVEGLIAEPDTAQALRGAELVLLLTEWREYRDLEPSEAARLVAAPRIIDGRTVLDLPAWRAAGWDVRALGRGTARPGAGGAAAAEPELEPARLPAHA
ncbi:UDP-glucose dehydrogenase family protein [Brachybacterium sp. J153]|uniref:UDP-glucose dehydrogenase family protein n=1 Tax=Brachybacterium sp. J153 TaxID=3116488 RepID=UPI002E7A7490|nr:UDP-glucose/GDP-mannose dehydrogenase family protein [Brachybacterium sp. J153]MEE1618747.1 UDP-glucose/GDP-mannose dehydrogenase family protein [Brachybacterium sp. J153]